MKHLKRAAELLRAGGVVAFPTDTVYGLGTNAFKKGGLERIYGLKGREPGKPLPVLIESPSQAALLARFDRRARALARAFWPGPLTLVLPATVLGRKAAGGAETIGLRVPDHPGLRRVIRLAGVPVASTSANRSGHPEHRSAGAVSREFGKGVDLVLDGGRSSGRASTVVSLAGKEPGLLREGRLSWKKIQKALL